MPKKQDLLTIGAKTFTSRLLTGTGKYTTNVVRVPFGIRQPQKQRPQRPESFITLVLPLQPSDSPTPPPQAA